MPATIESQTEKSPRENAITDAQAVWGGMDIKPDKALKLANTLLEYDEFRHARRLLDKVCKKPIDDLDLNYKITHKRAVTTYKDHQLNRRYALNRAVQILRNTFKNVDEKRFEESSSLAKWVVQETLGLMGAIHKRKWENDGDKLQLEKALSYYRRGYDAGADKNKYYGYTGINAAFLLDLLAYIEQQHGAAAERIQARRDNAKTIRREIINVLVPIVEQFDPENLNKNDYWSIVTLAEAYFGVDDLPQARRWLKLAMKVPGEQELWRRRSTAEQLVRLAELLGKGRFATLSDFEKSSEWQLIESFVDAKIRGQIFVIDKLNILCLNGDMARPLRIEYPGAYYHVMNRGNRREDIFLTDKDRKVFLDGLADSCETYGIKLITYVLMPNHFHLLVQTPQANLSEFMRHFLVTYTVRFNRRNGRSGHVFQGRFKSILVDEDEYLLPLSRYIHLNPIRTSQFKDSDYQTKAEFLKNYPWSTFPGYCYLRKRNKNIDYDWFLSTYFGEDTEKGRRQCRQYVYNAIEGEIENPFEEVVHQSILGAQDFVDWVRQKLPRKGQREVPSLTRLQQHISVERLIGEVAKTENAQAEDLRDRRTKFKELRQMAMELSYRCSNCKQKEIGAIFGVDYSTVSQSRARLKTRLKSNRKLKQQFDRLLKQMGNLSKPKI